MHWIICCSPSFSVAKPNFCCLAGTSSSRWLRPNYVRCIPEPLRSALSALQILDTSTYHQMLYNPVIWYQVPNRATKRHVRFCKVSAPVNDEFPITYAHAGNSMLYLIYTPNFAPTDSSLIVIKSLYLIPTPLIAPERQIWFHRSNVPINGCVAITVNFKTSRVCPTNITHFKHWPNIKCCYTTPWSDT